MQNFIFDIYGTLVDISTDEKNLKFRKKIVTRFKRNDFWERYEGMCAEMLAGKPENTEIDIFPVFQSLTQGNAIDNARYFRDKSRSRLKVYPHIRKTLAELKKRGARLFILSNAQSCFTLYELKKLHIVKYFDGIEISSDFGEKKPSQAFFVHIIKKFGLDPEQSIYIGNDFECDILGASRAGLKTAYIKSNISPAEDEISKADKVAGFATDSFARLSAYLLSCHSERSKA